VAKINWRKWNNILHRDIGYLAVGLTVVFAVSGIAVNHVGDWNPNYSIERTTIHVEAPQNLQLPDVVAAILRQLHITERPQSTFRPSPQEVQIFLENQTIQVNLKKGSGTWERVSERPLLRDFNYLHLNHAKKAWTYFSDLYAIALLFLAVSGLFVLKGKNGLAGRGKWLTGVGLLIPILFLLIYKYW